MFVHVSIGVCVCYLYVCWSCVYLCNKSVCLMMYFVYVYIGVLVYVCPCLHWSVCVLFVCVLVVCISL